jgi:hypothetical protein
VRRELRVTEELKRFWNWQEGQWHQKMLAIEQGNEPWTLTPANS